MSKKVKYVSDNTLRYFLQKIKALISSKADKTLATNYANGLMSKEDYSKLHNLKKSDITDFPYSMPPSYHTHPLGNISGGTANTVTICNNSGILQSSAITSNQLNTLKNIDTSKTIMEHLNGKASSYHTHYKSSITDFPTSMPASDVYSWAKQMNKPTYTWNEISSKPYLFPPSAHNHNDSYYTIAQTNSMLMNKADSSHKHSSSDITISQSTINAYQSMGMY